MAKTLIPRYLVVRAASRWVIFDVLMKGVCALQHGTSLVPLEFQSREQGQTWLYLCRVAWGAELIEPPEGWNGT